MSGRRSYLDWKNICMPQVKFRNKSTERLPFGVTLRSESDERRQIGSLSLLLLLLATLLVGPPDVDIAATVAAAAADAFDGLCDDILALADSARI